VFENVEPYSVVAGNPARLIRRLTPEESNDGH
jgi:acetyltransferase-like isoleucine patch superfamily enzyme